MKKDFKRLIENGSYIITKLQEPYLEINNFRSGATLSHVITLLVTQYGQRIGIKHIVGNGPDPHTQYIEDEKQRLSKIYGLKIILKNNPESEDIFKKDYILTGFTDLDETKMKKFTDTKHNTTYLLYSEGEKKYAYSIHYDYLLDTYAIRDFVNSLPTVQIDPQTLINYTIIAL